MNQWRLKMNNIQWYLFPEISKSSWTIKIICWKIPSKSLDDIDSFPFLIEEKQVWVKDHQW
jgi:hypothetical protein